MKRTTRRVLLIIFGTLVLLAGATALRIRYLIGGAGDYSQVASIQKAPEYQDPELLAKAWAQPVAAIYKRDGVDSQSNPSFCGPTSVVNVLRSLGDSADQKTILDGTEFHTTFGLLMGGMTLDQVAALLREKTHLTPTVIRAPDVDSFRSEVARSNDPALRYIVNLHRGPLFGSGGGHFSPIAGYLPAEDLVFVLDVNQRYHPWLVKTARLFAAVNTEDRSSGQKRGLIRLGP
jgi:hypothetical protein